MTVMRDADYGSTRQAWDRIWHASDLALEQATGEYSRSRAVRERYVGLLPDGGVVLEAGCGVGTEIAALGRLDRCAVGVDYALSALALLRTNDPSARLSGADVHRLPFGDRSLAAYLSFGVLEHFAFGPGPALAEAFRALGPRGLLVVTVPAPNLVWRAVRLRRALRGAPDGSKYYEHALSLKAIRNAVSSAGFVDVLAAPIDHAFTLWGVGGPFRGAGHYETSALAERLGPVMARLAPRAMAFATLVTARRPDDRAKAG